MNKKVISMKVSEEEFDLLNSYCKQKGITKLDYLSSIVTPNLNQLKVSMACRRCPNCHHELDLRGNTNE